MPRIKRYFPVSHDINRDPEVRRLTKQFGLLGLRLWLEILSQSDRNAGFIKGDFEMHVDAFAFQFRTKPERIRNALQLMTDLNWIEFGMHLRVVNYAEYHPSRGAKQIPPGNTTNSPLPNILTNKHKKEKKEEEKKEKEGADVAHLGERKTGGNGSASETFVEMANGVAHDFPPAPSEAAQRSRLAAQKAELKRRGEL